MDLWECTDSFIIKEEMGCKSECEVIIDVLEDSVDINPDINYPGEIHAESLHYTESKANNPSKAKQSRVRTTMRYGCMICSYKTDNSTNFKIHLRTHTGERPYKCDQCAYSAKVLCALYRHKRVHTGERPYGCQQCSYRAAQPSHLARHKMVHTGERPHSCGLCSYRASQMSHLIRHMSVHNNFRPYPCNECPYRAKRKSHLQKHLITHEKDRKNNLACTRELRSTNRPPFNLAEDDCGYVKNLSSSCKFCTNERKEFRKERKNTQPEEEMKYDQLSCEDESHPSDFVQIKMNEEKTKGKGLELTDQLQRDDV